MKFKKDVEAVASDSEYYDFFMSGHLDLEKFLVNGWDIENGNEARECISSYLSSLKREGLLEEM